MTYIKNTCEYKHNQTYSKNKNKIMVVIFYILIVIEIWTLNLWFIIILCHKFSC